MSSSLSPTDHLSGATSVIRPESGKQRWADYEDDDASTDISSDRDSLEPTSSIGDEALSCEDTCSVCSWEHGAQEWLLPAQQWQEQQPLQEHKEQHRQKKHQKQKKQKQEQQQQLIPTPCQHVASEQPVIANQHSAEKSEVMSSPPSKNGIKETAVMIRNMPRAFARKDVIATLNNLGFKDTFDVVFLPMTVTCSANFGYVFVNFFEMHHADELTRVLQGSRFSSTDADNCCEVTPAKDHGRSNLARHLRRYNAKHNSMPTDVFSNISDRPHDLFE